MSNKNDLEYKEEHGLNTKPILIDLLVITKNNNTVIYNEIGRIFKRHNIFEYKSPKDHLDIDVFYKVIAYACLYKSKSNTTNEIPAEEITITFVKESKPVYLFNQITNYGFLVKKFSNGIYYIKGILNFDIQFVVSKELDEEHHIWLKSTSCPY